MNVKIKELLVASGLQPYYDAQEKQIEKFSDLIIRECSSLTLDYKNDEHYAGWIEYRELIKHHFGFE